ncbi:hypothetical protein OG455_38650 [Kitasatospora sp. NBC_01287]|uniref:hypothetical protein n=1 Tax=Kitasatospora sp. NBC_01287 TaxID=2903573 RepID=UPI0022513EC9|nr:hypothetical protein [Kitasatospora sp. NBC_01287]MCX4751357.1 hypothetical protein [Kitasatospora sp. NBC_01287]
MTRTPGSAPHPPRQTQHRPRPGRTWPGVLLVAAVVSTSLALAACSSSSTSTTAPSSATPSFSPNTASFSGQAPSAVASQASSALSAVASAASSVSSAAASFEASVNARVSAGQAQASATLAAVSGTGNAVSDITITGVPKAQSAGLNAAVVTITNRTGSTASYAVQVDFVDPSGKTVASDIVSASNLAPGASSRPLVYTDQQPDQPLAPKLAKAERY